MIISDNNNVPGKWIKEVYGFVSVSTVRTKNIGKDIGASEVIAYGTAVLIEA